MWLAYWIRKQCVQISFLFTLISSEVRYMRNEIFCIDILQIKEVMMSWK